jgi:folate-dependent phosphoribosylglycinamide formyltransferase PurN
LFEDDSNRGRLYDVVCCLTSEDECAEAAVAAAHRVPVLAHPIRQFCHARGRRLSDPVARVAYDSETIERLAAYRLDLVVLASYLYVLTEPMLTGFCHRIINVHHSDLTLRGDDGHARLTGLRAVRDALLAGERDTRATVHLVTREPDQGRPFLRSWAFPVSPLVRDVRVWQDADVRRGYIRAHQDWMIRATWGPLIARAIELIACRRLDLSALARRNEIGPPWDLEEAGTISGCGPVGDAKTSDQMAWAS